MLGIEREHDGRHVRGRVGVGDRAAERAPVADLDVADARDDQGQQRHPAGRKVGVEHVGVGRQGTDPEPAVGQLADRPELG